LQKASYSGLDDILQLVDYYLTHIQRRLEKTKNAAKFPELSFYGQHLVEIADSINEEGEMLYHSEWASGHSTQILPPVSEG